MKITVHNVIIDRDMVTKIHKQLWPWETAVLREKFGDGKVRLQDTTEIEVAGLPDAKREFRRLAAVHGTEGGSVSYAEMAFGRGTAGVKELQKALKASTKKKRKPAAKKPEPVVAPSDEGDPLDAA